MKVYRFRIWFKAFVKSFVWLVFPLCVWGAVESYTTYKDAGSYLTPASINVDGYYRYNGSYVDSYKRRPPGSVEHDAPYERKRGYMVLFCGLSIFGGLVSMFIFYTIGQNEVRREVTAQKELFLREQTAKRNGFVLDVLKTLNFDFSELTSIPINSKLRLRKVKVQDNSFPSKGNVELLYVSHLAISRLHDVSLEDLVNPKTKKLGRNPISKFTVEVEYAIKYFNQFNLFKEKFLKIIEPSEYYFEEDELKRIFNNEFLSKISKNRIIQFRRDEIEDYIQASYKSIMRESSKSIIYGNLPSLWEIIPGMYYTMIEVKRKSVKEDVQFPSILDSTDEILLSNSAFFYNLIFLDNALSDNVIAEIAGFAMKVKPGNKHQDHKYDRLRFFMNMIELALRYKQSSLQVEVKSGSSFINEAIQLFPERDTQLYARLNMIVNSVKTRFYKTTGLTTLLMEKYPNWNNIKLSSSSKPFVKT